MKPTLLFLLLFVFAWSCGNSTDNMAEQSTDYEAKQMAYEEETAEEADDMVLERQIIKRADYRIQVEGVSESTPKIQNMVTDFEGYISSMDLTTNSYQISNNFVIRVPKENFETLLDAIGKEAIFTHHRRIYSDDVSEEFVDINTRLATKKAVRDRYVDILRNKAKTVDEVLKAEEAIRNIQEEIEAKEGRLKYLKDRVGMSTINLEIYQKVEYQPEPDTYEKSFGNKLWDSLENGWDLITGFVLVLATIWPVLLIGGLLFWQRKRLFFSRRKKESNSGK